MLTGAVIGFFVWLAFIAIIWTIGIIAVKKRFGYIPADIDYKASPFGFVAIVGLGACIGYLVS